MNTPFPLTREGEYISAINEQKAMQDPFWRKESEPLKIDKKVLDDLETELLAKEFEDYFKKNGTSVFEFPKD